MAFYQWEIKRADPAQAGLLAQECEIPLVVAEVLASRGYDSPALALGFLSEQEELSDPFLLKDMELAVKRIRQGIAEGERMAVYGDYDCDGVTATVILYNYLLSAGADVTYYIPERDGEGYGLNAGALYKLAEDEVTLVITVDNGISALEESRLARELGIDLVITDHHQPGDVLPEACAVVDPHRKDDESPFSQLCGAGVALKLTAALEDGDTQAALDYFADFAAIGTIGDVVPLVEENRSIVQYGLSMLKVTENIGLRSLMEIAGIKEESLTARDVAFGIVPRINAAGRMGSARLAVALLLCEEEEKARELAAQVDELNRRRQEMEAQIMKQIEEQLAEHPDYLNHRVLVLAGEGWHHGVVGIVSARLLERYGKPNILLSLEGEEARGSARSVGDFSLYHALCSCGELFTRFGGHRLAAGMSLPADRVDELRERINAYAAEEFPTMPQLACRADGILRPELLSVEQARALSVLEPCGERNPAPVFCLPRAIIQTVTPLSGGKHLRLGLVVGGISCDALYFGMTPQQFPYHQGETVDLMVTMEVNSFRGNESLSLKIKDMRPAGFAQNKVFAAKAAYEQFCREEPVDSRLKPRLLPTREEITAVYLYLRKRQGYQGDLDRLYLALFSSGINYCKLRLILDILNDVGLIQLSPLQNGLAFVCNPEKKDLSQSPTLQRILAL